MEEKKSWLQKAGNCFKVVAFTVGGAFIGAAFHEPFNNVRGKVTKKVGGWLGHNNNHSEESVEVENRPQQQYQPKYNNGGYNNNRFNNNK